MKAFLPYKLLAASFFALFVLTGVSVANLQKVKTKTVSDSTPIKKVTYKIIDAEKNSFGYDIFVDTKITVHQPSIPCLTGNTGFRYKKDAEKVAKLVVSKMKKGIMPPTVTIKEMETLGISLLQ